MHSIHFHRNCLTLKMSGCCLCFVLLMGISSLPAAGQTLYSIGNPTDEEQLLVELINRARMNANAEAQRLYHTDDPDILWYCNYFSVDMDQMTNQFTTLPQYVQPLSINEKLLTAARLHSQDMVLNRFLGHYSSSNCIPPNLSGDGPPERILRQGYNWAEWGEGCSAAMASIELIHASFEVDWGGANYGMHDPPTHRLAIHSTSFREIGAGIGYDPAWGPYTATHDFGRQQNDLPFITGVAYYDLNTNSFYDVGEGLQNVRIDVLGSTNYAVTSHSGGYSVPVASNGSYQVTFSGSGFSNVVVTSVVSSLLNQKHDFAPVYYPPVLVGPTNPSVGLTNTYSIDTPPGSVGFRIRYTELTKGTWVEGAEDGTNNITINASAGYDVIQSAVKATGSNAFHLAHPTQAVSQIVYLDRRIMPTSSSQLQFQSRLGLATTDQTAIVQVSLDGRTTWETVFSQAGDGVGEGAFTLRTVSLAAYSNREVAVRLLYEFNSGSYFYQTNDGIGWYIDDISVSNSYEVGDFVETDVDTAAFEFCPGSENVYLLQVRIRNLDRLFPYGPAIFVTAGPKMVVSFSETRPILTGTQMEVYFHVANGIPSGVTLDEASQVAGPYSPVVISPEDLGNGNYRYVYTPGEATCGFLRIRAQK